jgi:HEAT repeat protein
MRLHAIAAPLFLIAAFATEAWSQIHPDLDLPAPNRGVENLPLENLSPDRPDPAQRDPATMKRIRLWVDWAHRHSEADQLEALENLQSEPGPELATFAREIRPLLDAPSVDVARAAARVLWQMGPAANDEWEDAVNSPDGYTRRLALTILSDPRCSMRGIGTIELQIALQKNLVDPCPLLHGPAAKVLCRFWPRSSNALVNSIKAGDAEVKAVVLAELLRKPAAYLQGARTWNDTHVFVTGGYPEEQLMKELGQLVSADLLSRLGLPDEKDRRAAVDLINDFPPESIGDALTQSLIKRLDVGHVQLREDAAQLLSQLGGTATPGLVKGSYSNDPVVRWICVNALSERVTAKSDDEAIITMNATILSHDESIHPIGMAWLARLDKPPAGLVKILAGQLTSDGPLYAKDAADRIAAANALGRFAVEPSLGVPALVHTLEDDPQARMAAVVALRAFGRDALPAVPLLKNFINISGPLATEAAATLMVMGPQGRKAAVAYYVNGVLHADEAGVRMEILHELQAMGPDAESAVPALTKLLAGDDNDVRLEAARALRAVGPAAHDAVPALVRMTDNASPEIRHAAADALLRIAPDGKGISPALMAAVYNGDRACAVELAGAVARGEVSQTLRDRLADLQANDPDAAVRAAATRAVQALGEGK